MKNNHQVYRTGFAGQAFEISCNNDDAYAIVEFLFLDFPGTRKAVTTIQYDIISSGSKPMLSLWQGDKRLYFGELRYQLAYILMNEVIFHCINTNDSHHALHAGCVSKGDRCVILPGQSGNGKSTLTSWLVMHGFQYLTDELVFLKNDGSILPLTRPISLKVGASHPSWLLADENGGIIISNSGSILYFALCENIIPNTPRCSRHG
ncbi:hypothetical protein JWG39_14760 [Desulforhopalus vacuolatus]|uniref:hypothetical protein n=1 Tax=Desulforhopalus vacuolatus TaxID=40414 RepID=UPI0019632206|nr:hypothetical protein [Desulforhopalus vacuolatus]MBM9521080.1 hypothetical protein [Desulforhopalus vacuolatus]